MQKNYTKKSENDSNESSVYIFDSKGNIKFCQTLWESYFVNLKNIKMIDSKIALQIDGLELKNREEVET